MASRKKRGLSQKEIEKLMNDLDEETFADRDSECEMENFEEAIIEDGDEVSEFGKI